MSEPIKNRNGAEVVRIGLMSRLDYGSDGERGGLLLRAADTFRSNDVAFCVLAGGLVSAEAVKKKKIRLQREQRSLAQRIKVKENEWRKVSDDPKRSAVLDKEMRSLKRKADKVEKKLHELAPKAMAKALAKRFSPGGKWIFVDAKNRPVKLYIIPSPTYDKDVGEETARCLADDLGTDRVRLLKSGGDRLPLWEGEKDKRLLEVLTTDRTPWRGDYVSTGVERRIKDKRKQTSSQAVPDLTAVGGYAVSILKPRGESVMPYMAVPALYRIEDQTVNENQIGVQVMVVHRDRVTPTMRSFTYKDLISRERAFIGVPSDISPNGRRCLDVLRKHGRCTTGRIADETGLTKEAVYKLFKPMLATRHHKDYKTWPGLVYDALADSWDFDLEWVKVNLQHPPYAGEMRTDILVGFGCLHASSLDTDYKHFLTDVPKKVLEHGATVLVGAGDFVEGLAHNMMLRGDIYAGLNLTKQEQLAGMMIARVMLQVFRARLDDLLKKGSKKLDRDAVTEFVLEALIAFCWIPGNHDLWDTNTGHEPLVTMITTLKERLVDDISDVLDKKNLSRPHRLSEIVSARVQNTRDGKFFLPSGLKMAVMHPHMPRSKTTSIRPQEMMEKAADCQVVVGANFHVGEVIEIWDPKLGQRVCVQIGTMKHGSPFEDNKLKIVDQGFASAKITSIGGRIIWTETTFHSNDKASPGEKRLDPERPFQDFLRLIGLGT